MTSLNIPIQAHKDSAAIRKIVVYTSRMCNKCAVLKDWLKKANEDFEERDLEDVDVMAEFVMMDIVVLSAPVVEVAGVFYTENQMFDGDSLIESTLTNIVGAKASG